MTMIQYLARHVVYENPKPHLHSRHGYFPGLVQLASGELVGLFVLGEAFDSINSTTVVTRSSDLGRSWRLEHPLYDKSVVGLPTNDTFKPALLRDGRLIAMGYRFHRLDPEGPIADEDTGGIVPGDNIVSFSSDDGHNWTTPVIIPRTRRELYEISGACLQLPSGDIIALSGVYPLPDGTYPSGPLGVVLRSGDGGATWDDSSRFFNRPPVVPWETRACRTDDGRVIAISWCFDTRSKRHLPNHMVVSHDEGRTWSDPVDTGIMGQASNLVALPGGPLLTIHSHRAENPALVVRLVDCSKNRFEVLEECAIYGTGSPGQTQDGMSEARMFGSLRFGQPSLLWLGDGQVLATHWCVEDGQGKILTHRLSVCTP